MPKRQGPVHSSTLSENGSPKPHKSNLITFLTAVPDRRLMILLPAMSCLPRSGYGSDAAFFRPPWATIPPPFVPAAPFSTRFIQLLSSLALDVELGQAGSIVCRS